MQDQDDYPPDVLPGQAWRCGDRNWTRWIISFLENGLVVTVLRRKTPNEERVDTTTVSYIQRECRLIRHADWTWIQ